MHREYIFFQSLLPSTHVSSATLSLSQACTHADTYKHTNRSTNRCSTLQHLNSLSFSDFLFLSLPFSLSVCLLYHFKSWNPMKHTFLCIHKCINVCKLISFVSFVVRDLDSDDQYPFLSLCSVCVYVCRLSYVHIFQILWLPCLTNLFIVLFLIHIEKLISEF